MKLVAVAANVSATTPAARSRAVFARLGLVHGQIPSLELLQVEARDGLIPAASHLDKGESSASARIAVGHHLGRRYVSVLSTEGQEVVRGGAEGQIPNVQLLHESLSAAGIRLLTEIRCPARQGAGETDANGSGLTSPQALGDTGLVNLGDAVGGEAQSGNTGTDQDGNGDTVHRRGSNDLLDPPGNYITANNQLLIESGICRMVGARQGMLIHPGNEDLTGGCLEQYSLFSSFAQHQI